MQTETQSQAQKGLPSTNSQQNINKQEQFAQKIRQNDQIKILQRKITILKEGVFAERERKKRLLAELEKGKNRISKHEEQNTRKEKKYEELTAQLKKLKDDLIEERNKKHKIQEKIAEKQQQLQSQHPEAQNKHSQLGLFGFRGMFIRP